MNIERYMVAWIRQVMRSDEAEIRRVGFKSHGIEYRIMTGGLQGGTSHVNMEALVCDAAIAACENAGLSMQAVIEWYRNNKVMRPTYQRLGLKRVECKNMVQEQLAMLKGAIAVQLQNKNLY